ncbi:gluconate 2-dehydrogenase subunit 3 family protein [Breoghania sp.]|uniref:gluconate 2-dehydrogenase subunit 3 family protein n=1 Tax=Breoghania sp. TaxID=2065378 RepID=UPI00260E01B7|nr:gluconate 2-dehydrogenase subunit 3 family protein [Breoghania sp.]MDJ0930150.1 gluconate 2-dehydrogenase subunit 3 family protein [Breoghania sp.]
MVDITERPYRRSFLKASVASMAATTIPITLNPAKAADLPPLEEYKPVSFDAAEWAFILAACDRLISSEGEGPGAIETRIPVFIDLQLAGDFGTAADWYMEGSHEADADPKLGFQSPLTPAEIYHQGIPLFQEWCRKTHGDAFEALDAKTTGRSPHRA